jgi:hypothetical protein
MFVPSITSVKILYLSLVILVIIISCTVKEVHAYGSDGGYMVPSPQPTPNDTNNFEIQNILVQPTTIKDGDNFTVTATLANNSPNPIYVGHGACEVPFSVAFDSHVQVNKNNIFCTLQIIEQRLDPGTKITATSPYLDLVYHATEVGNTNATITFRFSIWDQTTQSNIEKTVSKSFQFMIYDHDTGIPSLNYVEHPVMILIGSPLKQVQSGIATKDVKCNAGFQLIFKAEDDSPACVKPDAAFRLQARGWTPDTTSQITYITNMWIDKLQQNYVVGQPINATVIYVGYYVYVEPDVKIFDINGTQVWFNCPFCYARTEAIQSPTFGTFTYHVRDYSTNNLPVINNTGIYTMVATLENKTAKATFSVIGENNKNPSPLKLSLSTDRQIMQSGKGLTISISVNNTLPLQEKIKDVDEWPLHDLGLDHCTPRPFGIAIFDGYYTKQNMTEGKPLPIFNPDALCPAINETQRYVFEPQSTHATVSTCSDSNLPYCSYTQDMEDKVSIGGTWYEGNLDPFKPRVYTLVGGDEWGHLAIEHFVVTNSTIFVGNLGGMSCPAFQFGIDTKIQNTTGFTPLTSSNYFDNLVLDAGNTGRLTLEYNYSHPTNGPPDVVGKPLNLTNYGILAYMANVTSQKKTLAQYTITISPDLPWQTLHVCHYDPPIG